MSMMIAPLAAFFFDVLFFLIGLRFGLGLVYVLSFFYSQFLYPLTMFFGQFCFYFSLILCHLSEFYFFILFFSLDFRGINNIKF